MCHLSCLMGLLGVRRVSTHRVLSQSQLPAETVPYSMGCFQTSHELHSISALLSIPAASWTGLSLAPAWAPTPCKLHSWPHLPCSDSGSNTTCSAGRGDLLFS